jgi:hypothetical protein
MAPSKASAISGPEFEINAICKVHKIGHRDIKFQHDFVIECYGYYCFGSQTLDLVRFNNSSTVLVKIAKYSTVQCTVYIDSFCGVYSYMSRYGKGSS